MIFRTRPRSALALNMIMRAVSKNHVSLTADDVFRITSLVQSDDILSLARDAEFMTSLQSTRAKLGPSAFSPFQAGQIDIAFQKAGIAEKESSELEVTLKKIPSSVSSADSVEATLAAMWEVASQFRESGFRSYDSKRVARLCATLMDRMRCLKASQVCSVSQAIELLNYQDHQFAVSLARHACDIAGCMSATELCRCYMNFSRLNVQDSFVAIVNNIAAKIGDMRLAEVSLFAQGVERQSHTSSITGPVVAAAAQRFAKLLDKVGDPAMLRSMLVALSHYRLGNIPATRQIVAAAIERIDEFGDRNFVLVFGAMSELGAVTAENVSPILTKLKLIVPTMDIRNIDAVMDLVSVLPFDTSKFMEPCLERIAIDAAKLLPTQLCFVLQLIASYPPAREHPVTPALARVAVTRKEIIGDVESIAAMVIALAELQFFKDEFFELADFLFTQRKGFKALPQLLQFLGFLSSERFRDQRLTSIVSAAVQSLAPTLTEKEIHDLRAKLSSIGFNDEAAQSRMQKRTNVLRAEMASRWRTGRGGRGRGRGRFRDDFIE